MTADAFRGRECKTAKADVTWFACKVSPLLALHFGSSEISGPERTKSASFAPFPLFAPLHSKPLNCTTVAIWSGNVRYKLMRDSRIHVLLFQKLEGKTPVYLALTCLSLARLALTKLDVAACN